MQAHHALLNEELCSLQGPHHVLAKSLTFLLVEHLSVEGTNLQRNTNVSVDPQQSGSNQIETPLIDYLRVQLLNYTICDPILTNQSAFPQYFL